MKQRRPRLSVLAPAPEPLRPPPADAPHEALLRWHHERWLFLRRELQQMQRWCHPDDLERVAELRAKRREVHEQLQRLLEVERVVSQARLGRA